MDGIEIVAAGSNRTNQLSSLRSKIKQHSESKSHLLAENVLKKGSEQVLDSMFDHMSETVINSNMRIFQTAYCLAKHHRPFLQFEELIELQKINGLNMGSSLHSRITATRIIHVIAKEMRQQLITRLIESNSKFTIMIDESTTLSTRCTLILYILSNFDSEIPIVVFLDLTELDWKDTVDIEKALWLSLEKIGISKSFALKNWIAFASDGASVMLWTGVPLHSLNLIHHSHSSTLSMIPVVDVTTTVMTGTKSGVAAKLLHDVIKDVQGVSRFQSLMDILYSYYHQRPKNSRALDEACLKIGIEMKKIGRILNVRWSASSYRTIKVVWENYPGIHKHVSQTLEPGLKKKLESSSFLEELGLFYDVLFELGMLSQIINMEDWNNIPGVNTISFDQNKTVQTVKNANTYYNNFDTNDFDLSKISSDQSYEGTNCTNWDPTNNNCHNDDANLIDNQTNDSFDETSCRYSNQTNSEADYQTDTTDLESGNPQSLNDSWGNPISSEQVTNSTDTGNYSEFSGCTWQNTYNSRNYKKYESGHGDQQGTRKSQLIFLQTLRKMMEAGLNFEKCDTIEVTVSGMDKYAIPIIMNGRDMIASAQTGSGKTAAYVLPILNSEPSEVVVDFNHCEPQVLILAPTRELAIQIRERGVNINVATPGRLLDFMNRGLITFSSLRFFVLDEADRILDMGFSFDIEHILSDNTLMSSAERSTIMISATLPIDIQQIAKYYLKPDYISVAVGENGGACKDVTQTFVEVNKFSKKKRVSCFAK
ncbi:hypothetical protein QTP88_011711 [Uroleucon formosanum]